MAQSEAALTLQLWRELAKMEDCDELFHWLLNALLERFGVQIVQLWTYQVDGVTGIPSRSSRSSLKLRALAHRDLSPPWNMLTGVPTAKLVEYLIQKQKNIPPQVVNTVYPAHLATLLQRYRVNFCAGYSVSTSVYLSVQSAHQPRIAETILPQKLALLLFPHSPLHTSIADVRMLLQQALVMAERQHLVRIQPIVSPVHASSSLLSLNTLIPCHMQNAGSNPLALSLVISEKHARLLYAAIDDRKTLAELMAQLRFENVDFYTALRTLLEQGRIQLYEAGKANKILDYRQLFTKKGR